jgi:hypothetical protein
MYGKRLATLRRNLMNDNLKTGYKKITRPYCFEAEMFENHQSFADKYGCPDNSNALCQDCEKEFEELFPIIQQALLDVDVEKAPILTDEEYEDMYGGRIIYPAIQKAQRDSDHDHYSKIIAITREKTRKEIAEELIDIWDGAERNQKLAAIEKYIESLTGE